MPPSSGKLFENFDDIDQPILCDVTGELPSWLNGTLLRNGPGMFTIGDAKFKHLFDGLAYIQRYKFNDGKAYYNAKFLRSETYKRDMNAKRIVASEFGTTRSMDPTLNIFRRLVTYFQIGPETDNALVNILQCGDNVYATTEVPLLLKINIETLDTIGKDDMRKYVKVDTLTAHQHYDEEGNSYNIGTQFGRKAKYVFIKTQNPKVVVDNKYVSDFASTTVLSQIDATDAQNPTYYHSFAMTPNYMVLFESPLRINVASLLFSGFLKRSYRDSLHYNSAQRTIVRMVNRTSGKEFDVKVTASNFFTFHHANSFEKDGHLFMDYSRYDSIGTLEFLEMDCVKNGKFNGEDNSKVGYLYRMIIPLHVPPDCKPGTDLLEGKQFAGKCRFIKQSDGSFFAVDDKIYDIPIEFPRYNYDLFNAKPYRYVYGAVFQSAQTCMDGLLKIDVESKTAKVWKRDNEYQFCSEPVFVPSPDGVNEDDGILLCPVVTTEEGAQSFVLVLNAREMDEIARCYVNCRMPFSFHGHFVHPIDNV